MGFNIFHAYAMISLLCGGVFLYQAWLNILSFKTGRDQNILPLFSLTVASACLCIHNFISTLYLRAWGDGLVILIGWALTVSASYFYFKTMVTHLNTNDRLLSAISKGLVIYPLAMFLTVIWHYVYGSSWILANQERFITKNLFLNWMMVRGNVSLLGLIYVATNNLIIMTGFLRIIYLGQKQRKFDRYLYLGVVVSIIVNLNDALLAVPTLLYIFPLAFVTYFLEILRLTYLYHRSSALKIEELRGTAIHVSKAAEIGFMAAQINHDLNNPLSVLKCNLSVLYQNLKDQEIGERYYIKPINRMDKATDRMIEIVSTYLKLVRTNNNANPELIKIKNCIQEAIELVDHRLRKLGPEGLRQTHEKSIEFIGFENEIIMALVNTINNSMDAISDQPSPWIKITTKEVDSDVEIRIIDSGPGIPRKIQETIFDNSFTTKARGKGTGLGLNFVRMVADHHRGKVFVDPHHPNTCIVLRLPLRGIASSP